MSERSVQELAQAVRRHYWIYTQTVYCPICWRERVTRERRYTQKPERWIERNVWIEHWDGCEL